MPDITGSPKVSKQRDIHMSDDACKVEFRYLWNHIYKLIDVMNFRDTFTCYNGLKFDAVEGICIFLRKDLPIHADTWI